MRWLVITAIGVGLLLALLFLSETPLSGIVNEIGGLRAQYVEGYAFSPRHAAVNAASETLEWILERHRAENKATFEVPPPIIAINFGTADSPIGPGQHKDSGQLFEQHPEVGYGWGWNCDLQEVDSTRARENVEVDVAMRSVVIPDRHHKCVYEPSWSIDLKPGNYTVKVSSTDVDYHLSSGSGCHVQGVKLGDLPSENTCATDEDVACVLLPRILVRPGELLEIYGSYRGGCDSLNYVEIYEADDNIAAALSTFQPLETNIVDPAMLKAEPELNAFLQSIADENRDVIAASVNAGYIDFAMNWLCSISEMGLTNYFLIATDDESYHYFSSRGYATYHVKKTREGEGNTAPTEYGTVEYQELILQRTKLVNKVLHLGFNILLCDVDAVWLKSPIPYLSHGYDIQSQPENDGRLCGGFMFMLSTRGVQTLWQNVTDQHEAIVRHAEMEHALDDIDQSEQALLLQLLPHAHLRVKRLDSDMFPHGLKFFGPQLTFESQMDLSKIHPAVVHNNYVIGRENKKYRFEHFGLWFIADKDEDYACHLHD